MTHTQKCMCIEHTYKHISMNQPFHNYGLERALPAIKGLQVFLFPLQIMIPSPFPGFYYNHSLYRFILISLIKIFRGQFSYSV